MPRCKTCNKSLRHGIYCPICSIEARTKVCVECGATFLAPHNPIRQTCSPACKKKHKRKSDQEWKGAEFTSYGARAWDRKEEPTGRKCQKCHKPLMRVIDGDGVVMEEPWMHCPDCKAQIDHLQIADGWEHVVDAGSVLSK